jgi:uncharacterized protein (DUF1501 family)
MTLTRRELMKHLSSLPLLGLAGGATGVLSAPGAGETRFLLVFLRGAVDAANVLVPTHSSLYYEMRPTIAIAKPGSDPAVLVPNAAIALDDRWGLHPTLADSMLPLWRARQLAFVPFAGSPDLSRSHFETQDTIEAGRSLDGPRDYGSGFMARLAEELGGGALSVSFTDGMPACWQGATGVPNVSLKAYGKAPFDDRQAALLRQLHAKSAWAEPVNEGLQLRREVAQQYEAEMQEVSRNAISAKGFELEARRMARLMRERFNLGFIDVGGWDTHVNEGGATGTLANQLGKLGRGLSAFSQEMGSAWGNTTVVVISEFGRTLRENGTKGTDHGHGSVYWLLGGSLRGGVIAGQQVDVTAATLNQNRDYPVLSDVRSLLGGVFQRLYGLSNERMARVFPRATPLDLQLV